jgi:lactoylglutathione lyase
MDMFADPSVVDEVVHEGWINHEAIPEHRYGREGARGTALKLGAAFADLRCEPHHVIADGDMVAVHLTMHARHVGEFAGIAPTGREFSVRHVHLFRVVDGLIAEHWAVRDDAGMMSQLDGSSS